METREEKQAQIIARDKNTCRVCGSHDDLRMHLVYNEKGYTFVNAPDENYVTLCKACEDEVHALGMKYRELEAEAMSSLKNQLRTYLLKSIYKRDFAFGGNVDLAGQRNRGVINYIHKLKECITVYDYALIPAGRQKQRIMEDIPEDVQNDFQDIRRGYLYSEWDRTQDVEHMKKLGASNSFIEDLVLGKKRVISK